jgi:hypothetical protein
MAGKGELVNYTLITATTQAERDALKKQISDIIDAATGTITIQAMVQAFPDDIIKGMLEKIKEIEKKK